MVYKGENSHDKAIGFCKMFYNAGLPLPKSKGEAMEFLKITGSQSVWIGLTDSTKNGNKAAWKDLDGFPIGNRYVNLRVKNIHFLSHFMFCN